MPKGVDMSRFDPLANVYKAESEADHRACGRLTQEAVVSSLGPVLDLSSTGMKVQSRRVPKGRSRVILQAAGTTMAIVCETRWAKKVGFLKYQVGLEFIEVDEQLRTVINQVAMNHRARRTM